MALDIFIIPPALDPSINFANLSETVKCGPEFERCVARVKKTVKPKKGQTKEQSAFAICTSSFKKAGKSIKNKDIRDDNHYFWGIVDKIIEAASDSNLEFKDQKEFDKWLESYITENIEWPDDSESELSSHKKKKKKKGIVKMSKTFYDNLTLFLEQAEDGDEFRGFTSVDDNHSHGVKITLAGGKYMGSTSVNRGHRHTINVKEDNDIFKTNSSGTNKHNHDLSFDEVTGVGLFPFYEMDSDNEKFCTTISLKNVKFEEGLKHEIEILREGKFNHPVFGNLNITKKVLNSLIKNFESNVLDREISFDAQHEPQFGAVYWVEGLKLKDKKIKGSTKKVLVSEGEFTKPGAELIKSGQFKYFSSEFSADFTDKESGKSFGPTLFGGGVTNRPFIPGLSPINLSETPGMNWNSHVYEEDKEVVEMAKKDKAARIKAAEKEIKELNEQITSLNESMPEDDNESEQKTKATETLTKLEAVRIKAEEKLSEIRDEKEEDKETEKRNRKLDEKIVKADELVRRLENKEESISGKEEKLDKRIREMEKKEFVTNLREDGHTEAVIRIASEVFDGMEDTVNKEITLTETTGEGDDKEDKEIKVSLTEAIRMVLNAVPESGRVDTSEKGEHMPPSKEKSEADDDINELSEPTAIRSMLRGAGHLAREGETKAA